MLKKERELYEFLDFIHERFSYVTTEIEDDGLLRIIYESILILERRLETFEVFFAESIQLEDSHYQEISDELIHFKNSARKVHESEAIHDLNVFNELINLVTFTGKLASIIKPV